MTTTTHNTIHKRYQHNINQIKNILQQNNLTITKADKSKTSHHQQKHTKTESGQFHTRKSHNMLK